MVNMIQNWVVFQGEESQIGEVNKMFKLLEIEYVKSNNTNN